MKEKDFEETRHTLKGYEEANTKLQQTSQNLQIKLDKFKAKDEDFHKNVEILEQQLQVAKKVH
jgi:predicted phage gp36 major capsid-like protein